MSASESAHRAALLALCAVSIAAAIPVHAGTLTVCSEASPDGFDIAQSESAVTHDAVGNTIYDQLVTYRRGTAELVPGLAERWEASADGLHLTLHLRRGVKFHTTPWFKPTREFNADDVLFSIRRMGEKQGPWHDIAKNGYGMYAGSGLASALQRIDKIDDHTVRMTLTRPNATFVGMLALSFTGSVFSAEYGAQLLRANHAERINTQPVGTGPFVFRSYQKDAVIRFIPHKPYWGAKPGVDALVFAITPDANVRVQRLKAGECLVGANMKGEAYPSFDTGPVKMLGSEILMTGYIALNTQKPPLSDARFRLALALALDQTSYVKSVYGGRATPAGSFLPPSQWSHDETLRPRFDPERAKTLVKDSGYDGREFAIMTRIGGSIDGRRAAELMQADWARIGVKARIEMVEWGELLKRAGRGEFDLTFLNWVGSGDPDDFYTPNLSCDAVASGGNKSRWCDRAFDKLLEQARTTFDRSTRAALYREVQKRVYDDVPLIATVYPFYFTAVHQNVRGFIPSPLSDLDFRGVSVP